MLYPQIHSAALTRDEKRKLAQLSGKTPGPKPVSQLPRHVAPLPSTADDIRRHRIVENAARRAIFGLPKVVHDDELDDPVEDDGAV